MRHRYSSPPKWPAPPTPEWVLPPQAWIPDSCSKPVAEGRKRQPFVPSRPLCSLDHSPFAKLTVAKPVDRYDYVVDACRGERVLDLGAYDETEVHRHGSSVYRWLHADITAVAEEVLGVDAAEALRSAGEIETKLGTKIVYGLVEDLDDIIANFRPTVIVAGELIEHTQDTLGWLSRVAARSPGVRFLATTPNTTSIINMMLAFFNRELAHPDHTQVYSYRTLWTLAGRVPMTPYQIFPYYYNRHLLYARVPKWCGPLVTLLDKVLLRPVQRLFPLTSTGLILDGRMGKGSET